MAASSGARLQRKAARTAGSAVSAHSFRRCYGIQFTNRDRRTYAFEAHLRPCSAGNTSIEHRLTKIKHPWTNGQVERMNRTIKDATVKRFHYDNHDQLRNHLADFICSLQFRSKTEDPQRPHALRVHLQTMDNRTRTVHPQPNPSNAGTKHLVMAAFLRGSVTLNITSLPWPSLLKIQNLQHTIRPRRPVAPFSSSRSSVRRGMKEWSDYRQ